MQPLGLWNVSNEFSHYYSEKSEFSLYIIEKSEN